MSKTQAMAAPATTATPAAEMLPIRALHHKAVSTLRFAYSTGDKTSGDIETYLHLAKVHILNAVRRVEGDELLRLDADPNKAQDELDTAFAYALAAATAAHDATQPKTPRRVIQAIQNLLDGCEAAGALVHEDAARFLGLDKDDD